MPNCIIERWRDQRRRMAPKENSPNSEENLGSLEARPPVKRRLGLMCGIRERAGYITGRPVGATALMGHDAERYSVARLQCRLYPLQIVGRVDRVLIDR